MEMVCQYDCTINKEAAIIQQIKTSIIQETNLATGEEAEPPIMDKMEAGI